MMVLGIGTPKMVVIGSGRHEMGRGSGEFLDKNCWRPRADSV